MKCHRGWFTLLQRKVWWLRCTKAVCLGELKKQPCGCTGEIVMAMMECVYAACCCQWAPSVYSCVCLPHPNPFKGVIYRLWPAACKEQACFSRCSNLIAFWNQNVALVCSLVLFVHPSISESWSMEFSILSSPTGSRGWYWEDSWDILCSCAWLSSPELFPWQKLLVPFQSKVQAFKFCLFSVSESC